MVVVSAMVDETILIKWFRLAYAIMSRKPEAILKTHECPGVWGDFCITAPGNTTTIFREHRTIQSSHFLYRRAAVDAQSVECAERLLSLVALGPFFSIFSLQQKV